MLPLYSFFRSSCCLSYSRSSRDFLGFFSAPATRSSKLGPCWRRVMASVRGSLPPRSLPAVSRSSREARDLPSRRSRMAVRVADWSGSRPWRLLSWVRASSARRSSSASVAVRSSDGSGMEVGLLELAGDQLGDRAALALDEGDVAEQRLALEPLDQGRH